MEQAWDASGRRTLRLDSRVVKFMNVANIGWNYTGGAQSGTITDARFTAFPLTTPIAIIIKGIVDTAGYIPTFTFSGNTLTWSFRDDRAVNYTRPDTTFVFRIL